MKLPKKTLGLFLLCFILLLPCAFSQDRPQKLVIEDFSNQELEKFPQGFNTYPFQHNKAKKVYSVQADGNNRFLNAKTEELGVVIFKKFPWDLKKTPYLSWRWRAQSLPRNAAENKPKLNDSSCAVYIIFGGFGGKVIKYVWSSSLPIGTIVEDSPRSFYIVAESGEGKEKQWQEVKVNANDDFQYIFSSEPKKNPVGIAILTDGDQTHSLSSCDYDDFAISEK
jgi:hypothetical protein